MINSPINSVPLEFLLVSSDHATLKTVQGAIHQIQANLGCTTTPDAAREYLSRHKVDGIILDVPQESASDVIAAVRHGTNHRAFVFACVGEKVSTADGLKTGANVVLHKPLTKEAIVSNIRTFKGILLAERRHYFRHSVTLPVSFVVDEKESRGMMENISEGGMAVRVPRQLAVAASVEFSFDLPFGPRIQGRAKVVWSNRDGLSGFEFLFMHEDGKGRLQKWLLNRNSGW